jgi:hypothetical protein
VPGKRESSTGSSYASDSEAGIASKGATAADLSATIASEYVAEIHCVSIVLKEKRPVRENPNANQMSVSIFGVANVQGPEQRKKRRTEYHENKGGRELLAFRNQGLEGNHSVPICVHFCDRDARRRTKCVSEVASEFGWT